MTFTGAADQRPALPLLVTGGDETGIFLPSLVTGNGEIGILLPFSMSSPVTHMFATGSQICRSCSGSMVEGLSSSVLTL